MLGLLKRPPNRQTGQILPHKIELRFLSFEKHYEIGCQDILSFEKKDCRQWHTAFVEDITSRIGSGQHMPVFRISHGEFIMALGYRLPRGASVRSRMIFRGVEIARAVGMLPAFYSGSVENSYETFRRSEIKRAKDRYVDCVRKIAAEGYLAVAFIEEDSYAPYLDEYCEWLGANDIRFSVANYVPFYSVYAMLMGPDRRRFFEGRRILVVTWLNREKEERIRRAVSALGARSCLFYNVSPTKAMFDCVNVGLLREKVDVVLVGAGVGAANIIEQVRDLGSLCIDCGFVLDALADPENRWNRQFCVDDSEFDYKKIRFFNARDLTAFRERNTLRGRSNAALDALERYRKESSTMQEITQR
jgi:hypothetical protein